MLPEQRKRLVWNTALCSWLDWIIATEVPAPTAFARSGLKIHE